MDPFTVLVRDGSHIYREKIQVGLQEMELHNVRKVAPSRFLRNFLIFNFPKSCCIRFRTRPRLFSRYHSISFKAGVLKKLFYLRTDENAFFYLGLACEWKLLP